VWHGVTRLYHFLQKVSKIDDDIFGLAINLLVSNVVFNQKPFVFSEYRLVKRLVDRKRSNFHLKQDLVEDSQVLKTAKSITLLKAESRPEPSAILEV
jgi:hypothetical protein